MLGDVSQGVTQCAAQMLHLTIRLGATQYVLLASLSLLCQLLAQHGNLRREIGN